MNTIYVKNNSYVESGTNTYIGNILVFGPHQVPYKAVASRLQVKLAWAEYISFYTIVSNYDGPLAADIARIDDATHIKVAKYEANFVLELTLIRSHTRL